MSDNQAIVKETTLASAIAGQSSPSSSGSHVVDIGLIKEATLTKDEDLRILIFTATYFVLDGVTLTIRRLESHLRSKGAKVKILSTVPDDCTPDQVCILYSLSCPHRESFIPLILILHFILTNILLHSYPHSSRRPHTL